MKQKVRGKERHIEKEKKKEKERGKDQEEIVMKDLIETKQKEIQKKINI